MTLWRQLSSRSTTVSPAHSVVANGWANGWLIDWLWAGWMTVVNGSLAATEPVVGELSLCGESVGTTHALRVADG